MHRHWPNWHLRGEDEDKGGSWPALFAPPKINTKKLCCARDDLTSPGSDWNTPVTAGVIGAVATPRLPPRAAPASRALPNNATAPPAAGELPRRGRGR